MVCRAMGRERRLEKDQCQPAEEDLVCEAHVAVSFGLWGLSEAVPGSEDTLYAGLQASSTGRLTLSPVALPVMLAAFRARLINSPARASFSQSL